jgi:hypothetical protein
LPKKRGQTPEDRAHDLNGALDWLRSKAPGAAGDDSIPSFDMIGSVPMSRRSPEQRAQDLEDALNWMRNKGDEEDANDPTGDFRKLDSLLPKKRSQKADKEISEAIDLWRDNGKTFGVESLKVSHKERATLSKLHDSMLEWRRNNATNISEAEAEQTVKDMINAMNWWKKKGKDHTSNIGTRIEAVLTHDRSISGWTRLAGF